MSSHLRAGRSTASCPIHGARQPFIFIFKAKVVICFDIAPRSSAPFPSRDQAQGDAMHRERCSRQGRSRVYAAPPFPNRCPCMAMHRSVRRLYAPSKASGRVSASSEKQEPPRGWIRAAAHALLELQPVPCSEPGQLQPRALGHCPLQTRWGRGGQWGDSGTPGSSTAMEETTEAPFHPSPTFSLSISFRPLFF